MTRTRSTRWPQVGLAIAVALLAVVGLVLIGAYYFLSRQTVASTAWSDPQALVRADAVAPDVAVLTLTGEPDERIVRAALDAGERETAYATLTYSVLLPDTVRSGQWLVMANAYSGSDPERARVAHQAALDLAALGPTLGDPARADVSLQVARGLTSLEQPGTTPQLAVAQAENIARYSLTLLPAQRRDILSRVASAYDSLGQPEAAELVRDNVASYSAGPGLVVQRPDPLLPTLRGTVVLPPDVIAALSARQQAAASLAARWLSSGPGDRDVLAATLGEALEQEDAARSALYATLPNLDSADQIALLHDQVNWLSVKLRVARGDYGLALVSSWEEQSASLASELAVVYTALINGYGRLLDTLDPVEAAPARQELLRQGVLWVRLGLFPDQAAEESLARQLAEASRELWSRQGGVGLTIVSQTENGLLLYLLAGSDARVGGS
jgi:hypothetical protein